MLRYNLNFKNGIAKARMCMAACVAVSTLTLGFTSRAAAMPEENIPEASLSHGESFFTEGTVDEINSKSAKAKIKKAEGLEEALAEAEEKAKELEAQREAERKREEEERRRAEEEQAAAEAQAQQVWGAVSSVGGSYEKELLASIIFCEAGNQSFEGQVAVGAVIMNRIASGAYPNTIEGVIYQPGQFGPAGSGWLDRIRSTGSYSSSAMQAAEAALAGQNPIGGCLYFDQGGYGIQIGAHFFH